MQINFVEKQTNALFLLLLIIPVFVICISVVGALIFNKKRLNGMKHEIRMDGYAKLLAEEESLDIDEDKRIFS